MTQKALDLLKTPKTASQLARELGLTPEAARLLLHQLARRGYAKPLPCGTACGTCAFRGVCQEPGEVYWWRT
ncbi:hypothetical protein [Thermus brockianus]|uniref:Transcriptional regulator HTH-type FeoC domain-containing protein n=1 Tax=Thermus brockianus TaxID=56956 RepID=A0ABN6NG53_THEBO|nr:hypothetical protein [Thermus brockianus]BDG16012.1 hypothetical protein TbrSNM41_07460 [Thermus brockianus]